MLANHGSSGDGSSSGCGSGSTGWIVAAGWAATVVASRLAGLRVATGGDYFASSAWFAIAIFVTAWQNAWQSAEVRRGNVSKVLLVSNEIAAKRKSTATLIVAISVAQSAC